MFRNFKAMFKSNSGGWKQWNYRGFVLSFSSTACICKSKQSERITSTASSSYSIAVLRNKLLLFLVPFSFSSLFIIFNKCDDSVFGKSDSFSFSHFPGAMSREGHCGHRENSIVLITAMIDRLCYEMSGERDWDSGKAELRNREQIKKLCIGEWEFGIWMQSRWDGARQKRKGRGLRERQK